VIKLKKRTEKLKWSLENIFYMIDFKRTLNESGTVKEMIYNE
jgi:hypothetical protein